MRERRETAEQRQRRLARQQEYNQRRRRAESPITSANSRGEGVDLTETQEHYQARLQRQRDYAKRRRSVQPTVTMSDASHETEEERRHRSDYHRDYMRTRRAEQKASGSQLDESVEQREVRLAKQRQYAEKKRTESSLQQAALEVPDSNVQNEQTPSVLDLQLHEFDVHSTLDAVRSVSTETLTPVAPQVVKQIEDHLEAALGAEGLDECACAVCDRLVLRRTCRLIDTSDRDVLRFMHQLLRPPKDLPEALKEQYCCSHIDPNLDGMMLSHKGLKVLADRIKVTTCAECHSHLVKGGDKPPKYAIANGFYIGLLPDDLSAATWIEKVMTQLVTVVAQTRVMRGGRHRAIRSHCMVFDATPGPPATLLPRRVDRDGPYRVVLAGPMTSVQTDHIKKLHNVRGHIVQGLLSFFKTHNAMYDGVVVDEPSIASMEMDKSLFERIAVEVDDPEAAQAVDEEQESIGSRPDTGSVAVEDESYVIERNVLLADEGTVTNSGFVQQRVVDLNSHESAATPRLRVDHSSRFASNEAIEAKMFPHLFPFGRGHPNEARPNPVSKRDCIRYYATLSSRRFAQDPTFLLTAFSRLALENMYTLTAVKCRRYGSLFEGYEGISREDLMAALVNNERRHRGERRQELANPTAERFLKSVELGSVSVWGSSAERRNCRQEAFGYQTRFGQPALFVTLTPNTDNSYAMAHYSGILSVDSLFDVLEARVPSPTEMKKAAMMDDCASARLFMRTVDAFITHVLGIDPKTQQTSPEGGRFGRTKAYYGMVETQGRGTLHIHFIIWLFGAPVNSEEFDERVTTEGSMYMEGLETYADSIVRTELPIPVQHARCQSCQTHGEFAALPIPSKARRSTSRRRVKEQLEPLLVKCQACDQESSVQHMIRQVLLQHRPPHWPPPLMPINQEEMLAIARREARTRKTLEEALVAVEHRELFHAAVQRDRRDEIAEWMLRVSDSFRLGYTHADDDALKVDPMHRFIEMTPPTLDRNRMSPDHYAYMLASLVVNLNTHAWTHTTSCFKASRATSSACVCRYGFPRERSESSSLSGPSVKLKRTLGHEYVNGYNDTIMAMFKCNHDVQIMFGGKDAINRIYYICKYVTKPQRHIDSAIAVALAQFQRRQAKESTELASETPPTLTDIRRRRVTGLVHTLTNKQEIAGPLAVLYILRGSCCYASEVCAKLPLSDILKQLESSGDYRCSMVENQHAVFTSASNLDDYIFRPQSSSSTNLYEFTMQCYRRKATSTVTEAHRFDARHPLSASHCIAFRRKGAVPVIKGPRLVRQKDGMTRDELEEYAKIALVLFKPFRSLGDLLGAYQREDNPWHCAYSEWVAHRSEFTKTIMKNMNDYYAGRDAENEASLQGEDRDDDVSEPSESDCSSSDDGYSSGEYLDVEDTVDSSNLLDMVDESSDRFDEQALRAFPSPSGFSTRIKEVLQTFTDHDLVGPFASSCVKGGIEPVAVHFTADVLRKWVEDVNSDSTQEPSAVDLSEPIPGVVDRATSVTEIFDNALMPEQRQWNPKGPIPAEAPMYSGISVISRMYTLNELQHGAFAIVASHLLRRWRPSPDSSGSISSNEELNGRQLRMYLGGEGGTGKSRVIQAIQELCRSWQRPKSTVVCAMTGKAATLINGRTLASFQVSLRGTNSRIELQDVDCIIVDEVSMMSKIELLRLNSALNRAKSMDDKEVSFGGIHILFVGDIFQLPPVLADPIYVDPDSKKKKVTVVDNDGFQLWRKFDKVVILRESVRFKDDPEWGEGCSKARYGEWTPGFVKMINSRVIDFEADQPSEVTQPPPGTIFVSADNDTRTAINAHFIARAANMLPSNDLPIRVVANFRGALNQLSADDVSFIMGLPDNKLGRMAPYLDLIRGMPIQVTQNIRTQKGVANGTTGVLEHIEFPPGTTFRRALDKRTGAIVALPDKRPLFALLRLNRGTNNKPLAHGVNSGLFPVFPDAEPFKKSEIHLTPSSSGAQRVLSVKIKQFPFVCAVGATVYKVQGESLKSMVIVDWRTASRKVDKAQQAYLMVSRVVKRDGLRCLTPLTKAVTDWAKPSEATLQEDRRLAVKSDFTLATFYANQNAAL